MSGATSQNALLDLTAKIVSAHVSRNAVTSEALPSLVRQVYHSLAGLDENLEPVAEPPQPAVNPRKSVFPDYIICLEDGQKVKMLRRYLMTRYKLTPEQYRERWGLDPNYPMVAPNYAKVRSALAKSFGLGRNAPAAPEEAAGKATAVGEDHPAESAEPEARTAKAAAKQKRWVVAPSQRKPGSSRQGRKAVGDQQGN